VFVHVLSRDDGAETEGELVRLPVLHELEDAA
jgi:hypothetical protein